MMDYIAPQQKVIWSMHKFVRAPCNAMLSTAGEHFEDMGVTRY